MRRIRDYLSQRGVLDLVGDIYVSNRERSVFLVLKKTRFHCISIFAVRTSEKCYRVIANDRYKSFKRYIDAARWIENLVKNYYAREAWRIKHPNWHLDNIKYKEQDFAAIPLPPMD